MPTVAVVAGARPNFIKAAPVIQALRRRSHLDVRFVHTGQHYDFQMSASFIRDLSLPDPDEFLGAGGTTHAQQTGRVMVQFEDYIRRDRPDMVLVLGDVNSTLACALVAAKAGILVGHVEAGLRSFDRTMPEEINRVVTDSISDLMFTTSGEADHNLVGEGRRREDIHFVGNTMIDSLVSVMEEIDDPSGLGEYGVSPGQYLVVTFHRPANVDDPISLGAILAALRENPLPVLFPVHPRTRRVLDQLPADAVAGLHILEPQGYVAFLKLVRHSRGVLTDSGGIQEETTVLGVPCLTYRQNTERPITIALGTNRLIGTDPTSIARAIEDLPVTGHVATRIPPLWDGHASERLAVVVEGVLLNSPNRPHHQ